MPYDLVHMHQAKMFLADMAKRYVALYAAQSELASLDRAPRYLKLVRRLRTWLRQANFFWKGDHLTFLRAVAGYYSDYGAVLRLLKQEKDRGKFKPREELTQGA